MINFSQLLTLNPTTVKYSLSREWKVPSTIRDPSPIQLCFSIGLWLVVEKPVPLLLFLSSSRSASWLTTRINLFRFCILASLGRSEFRWVDIATTKNRNLPWLLWNNPSKIISTTILVLSTVGAARTKKLLTWLYLIFTVHMRCLIITRNLEKLRISWNTKDLKGRTRLGLANWIDKMWSYLLTNLLPSVRAHNPKPLVSYSISLQIIHQNWPSLHQPPCLQPKSYRAQSSW